MASKTEFEELLELLTGPPDCSNEPLVNPGAPYEKPLEILPSLPTVLSKYSENLRLALDSIDNIDDLWVDSLMVYAAFPVAAEQFKIMRQQSSDPTLDYETDDQKEKEILLRLDRVPSIEDSIKGFVKEVTFI